MQSPVWPWPHTWLQNMRNTNNITVIYTPPVIPDNLRNFLTLHKDKVILFYLVIIQHCSQWHDIPVIYLKKYSNDKLTKCDPSLGYLHLWFMIYGVVLVHLHRKWSSFKKVTILTMRWIGWYDFIERRKSLKAPKTHCLCWLKTPTQILTVC